MWKSHFKKINYTESYFSTKTANLRIPADWEVQTNWNHPTITSRAPQAHKALTLQSQQAVRKWMRRMWFPDNPSMGFFGFFLLRLDSVSLHVNCKPPYFSSCVVYGDSPSSALTISLAGSCTCGVSEYSSEMTVSQMWGCQNDQLFLFDFFFCFF